jgi:HSP20 family protein
MAEKHTAMARGEERRPARVEAASPFQMLERFAEEMDRVFDDFGFGRSWLTPRFGRSWLRELRTGRAAAWMPDIEMFSRNNELVIRADLPGLTRDDIKVDVTEDCLTIQGERKREHEEEQGGVYRCERSYGSFYRELPLPEGAITEQAKAAFKDGVLEVTMPAPPEHVRRGRRLEITETTKK